MNAISIGDALFTKTQKKVIGLLFGNPDKSFYTNEIMRLVSIGRGTVSRELERLVGAGLLTLTKAGNQKHYQANPDCLIFNELKQIIEKTSKNKPEQGKAKMDDIVEKHRQQILTLAKKNGIRNVRVFGSMARNEAKPGSDLDLLVELEEGSSGFALGGFLHDVSNLVHRKVDVVTEKSLHPSLREKVLHEANAL